MKKMLAVMARIFCIVLLGGLLSAFPGAETVNAAQKGRAPVEEGAGKPVKTPAKPAALPGQTVTTEFFSVTLPPEWCMPYPLTKKPGGVSAVFSSLKTSVSVNLNVFKTNMDVKKFANIIQATMKRDKLNPTAPKAEGKLYRIALSGKAKGEAWFGGDGKLCVATVILAPNSDIKSANAFLQALQGPSRALFPLRVK